MASEVANDTNEMKKAQSNSEARKNTLYGKDALMPQPIFDVLPYKETHTALQEQNSEKLAELLCSFVQSIA